MEACGCCGDSEHDEPSPKAKLSAPSYFCSFGFKFGAIGATNAVLLVWVGVWVLYKDNYSLPEHPRTYSRALASVGVATLLAVMMRSHALPASQSSRSTIPHDACHGVWHLLLEGYVGVLGNLGSSSPVLRDALGCNCCSCHGDFGYHCIWSICCAYVGPQIALEAARIVSY